VKDVEAKFVLLHCGKPRLHTASGAGPEAGILPSLSRIHAVAESRSYAGKVSHGACAFAI